MIKTLVFDLDNTLIEWKKEYICAVENTLEKLNIKFDKEIINLIDKTLTKSENILDIYTKQKLIDYVNGVCNTNLPIEFLDILLEEQANLYEPFTKEELDTIEYLNSKYELICITNWFTEPQMKRLENVGIAKYFKIILGGEKHMLKPNLSAFDIIKNKEESIMIGDSLKNDIYPALELGMKAIRVKKGIKDSDEKFRTIESIVELKEIL